MPHDGGPAFPRPHSMNPDFGDYGKQIRDQEGMSLLEWYAGLIAQGELAGCPPGENWTPEDLAEWSIDLAQALVDEISKRGL